MVPFPTEPDTRKLAVPVICESIHGFSRLSMWTLCGSVSVIHFCDTLGTLGSMAQPATGLPRNDFMTPRDAISQCSPRKLCALELCSA